MARSRYTKKRYGPYWEALGRFAYYFSRVEQAMRRTLILSTKTEEPVAKAIFSGTRTREAIAFVKRALAEMGKPLPREIKEAFQKIAIINGQRDRILHLGIEIDEDENAFVSDEDMTVSSKARKDPISVSDLRALSSDTIVCWARLVVFNRTMIGSPHPSQKAWERASQRPWRYKPPQPSPKKSPRLPKRKRSPRPQSSEG